MTAQALVLELVPTYAFDVDLAGEEGSLTLTVATEEIAVDLVPALRGEQGAAGDGSIQFPFAWGDASPRSVVVAGTGKLVYCVGLHIFEAFDGVGSSLAVGDAGDPQRLMATTQNDPAATGSYETDPAHEYGAATTILLTITPGVGATAGAGLLTLFIEQ